MLRLEPNRSYGEQKQVVVQCLRASPAPTINDKRQLALNYIRHYTMKIIINEAAFDSKMKSSDTGQGKKSGSTSNNKIVDEGEEVTSSVNEKEVTTSFHTEHQAFYTAESESVSFLELTVLAALVAAPIPLASSSTLATPRRSSLKNNSKSYSFYNIGVAFMYKRNCYLYRIFTSSPA